MPNKAVVRTRCLYRGIDAPDYIIIKDFFHFHIALSHRKIDERERPTINLINTFIEWFYAGFKRITGISINKEERSEVYKVGTYP